MNIVLGEENVRDIRERYIVLELDQFRIPGHDSPVTAYCVTENLSVNELLQIDRWRDLHSNLMKNYRLRNWSYCMQAIEHLQGRWNGQLDSFYQSLLQRIQDLQTQDLDETWTGVIDRS